jgi:hypothetical protein
MAQNTVMTLELVPQAKEQLESIADRRGMTQYALLSRMVEWFALQPEGVQMAVLARLVPTPSEEIAQWLLQPLLEDGRSRESGGRLKQDGRKVHPGSSRARRAKPRTAGRRRGAGR